MVGIKLREDGWFDAGADCEHTVPVVYLTYQAKQILKQALQSIGNVPMGELEKALENIPEPFNFRGHPYLEGNRIKINTPGLPGTCYLGDIVE